MRLVLLGLALLLPGLALGQAPRFGDDLIRVTPPVDLQRDSLTLRVQPLPSSACCVSAAEVDPQMVIRPDPDLQAHIRIFRPDPDLQAHIRILPSPDLSGGCFGIDRPQPPTYHLPGGAY